MDLKLVAYYFLYNIGKETYQINKSFYIILDNLFLGYSWLICTSCEDNLKKKLKT